MWFINVITFQESGELLSFSDLLRFLQQHTHPTMPPIVPQTKTTTPTINQNAKLRYHRMILQSLRRWVLPCSLRRPMADGHKQAHGLRSVPPHSAGSVTHANSTSDVNLRPSSGLSNTHTPVAGAVGTVCCEVAS